MFLGPPGGRTEAAGPGLSRRAMMLYCSGKRQACYVSVQRVVLTPPTTRVCTTVKAGKLEGIKGNTHSDQWKHPSPLTQGLLMRDRLHFWKRVEHQNGTQSINGEASLRGTKDTGDTIYPVVWIVCARSLLFQREHAGWYHKKRFSLALFCLFACPMVSRDEPFWLPWLIVLPVASIPFW